MDVPTSKVFKLLNKSQEKKYSQESFVADVKKYEKKEWKFILQEESEHSVSAWSDFMTACCTGDVAKVSSLLQGENQIDVNQRDSEGYTALLLASEGGHTEIVQQLLKSGANIDAQTKEGESALMKACRNGHDDVVKLLLDNNTDVNMKERLL